ncbi:hypothetical protein [Paenibacillus polymyxa]|uniref:hypothetical protein n=1 Tax=Paenibacillus polymyxa TaxID=1406 RepID=UPI000737BA34|nr:hypothetical protein [Paenibacillus polymyxa]NEU27708.1 hypothetical protein [Paenibacillus polymyxa]
MTKSEKLGKTIVRTVEILAFIALMVAFVFMAVKTQETFTPAQMDVFQQIMNTKMKVVITPFISLAFAITVLIVYLALNVERWGHNSEIKRLKLKIQELEGEQHEE